MIFIGLLYSKTLLLVAMLMMILSSFIELQLKPIRIIFFPDLRNRLKVFSSNKAYLLITLFFWISLFSFFNSSDKQVWQFFTLMKLPFLVLPFIFITFPAISRAEFNGILKSYILIIFFSTFGVIKTIMENLDSVLDIINAGQSIETPVDHIKYSLFVSFAVIIGLILLLEKQVEKQQWEKILMAFVVIYLFIFLHILAVRSGIVILYFNVFILFVRRALLKKEYIKTMFIGLMVFAIPFIAYWTIPTFKQKVAYSLLDFRMHQKDKEVAFSDGERFRSYEVGWELFKSSPVVGIGVGDILSEYEELYDMKYFIESPTNLPHNQFLTVATSTGVIGLILFILAFFFPLLYYQAYRDPFILALYVLMFLSFMVENTIERQYSVGFFITFLLLGLNMLHKREKSLNER